MQNFEAVLKMSQLLFWSFWYNITKHLTVSILGPYLFFRFCFIISFELNYLMFDINFVCIFPLTKIYLKYSKV